MITPQKIVRLSLGVFVFSLALWWPKPGHAEVKPITFPVLGAVRYSNDFGAPRTGHTHEGNDLMGRKGQALIAAVDGTIRIVAYPEPYWGYGIVLEDADGYAYWYIHINNDNPGTDDGLGGGMNAYAPDMVRRYPVVKGQLIGYMGDSGNAEATAPHLHFEIRKPNGEAINPFDSLQAAPRLGRAAIAPALPNELLPYAEFRGGAAIAIGEFDGNSKTTEFVTGAGPGGGPHVRIFNENDRLISQFFAGDPANRAGIDIAAADIDGDGIDEVIAGAGPGNQPEVNIYTKKGELLYTFLAYDGALRSGINVAAADIDGNSRAEIITGPRAGGGPQVRIFTPTGTVRGQFFAYATGFRGGIDVAVSPATETLTARIVTGAGPGGGPQVRVFSRFGKPMAQFFPYDANFRGGVRVSIGDFVPTLSGWEIVTSPASRGGPDFRVYSHAGAYRGALTAFEVWWRGGYDIAAGHGSAYVASGQDPRRASVRQLTWPIAPPWPHHGY